MAILPPILSLSLAPPSPLSLSFLPTHLKSNK